MRIARAAGFILLVLILTSPISCKKKNPTLRVGDQLPHVILEKDGQEVGLNELMRGKLSIILFWEKGCTYCAREMPKLEPLYDKYRDQGVLLVGIHMGPGHDAVDKAVEDNGLTFPMLIDQNAITQKRYGIVAVPSIFFIGQDGTVDEKILGGLPSEDLESLIKEKL